MKNDNEKETTKEEGLDNLSDISIRKLVLTKHVLFSVIYDQLFNYL